MEQAKGEVEMALANPDLPPTWRDRLHQMCTAVGVLALPYPKETR
jgi:hypothetical protein